MQLCLVWLDLPKPGKRLWGLPSFALMDTRARRSIDPTISGPASAASAFDPRAGKRSC